MDKTSFELKANINSFETTGDDGKLLRIEAGQTYTTSNPNEIANLSQQSALKTVDTPEGARAGSRTQADDGAADNQTKRTGK